MSFRYVQLHGLTRLLVGIILSPAWLVGEAANQLGKAARDAVGRLKLWRADGPYQPRVLVPDEREPGSGVLFDSTVENLADPFIFVGPSSGQK